MAQEIKFQVPDEMVVRGGVAVIVGYDDSGGDERMIISVFEGTPPWVQASILESAARRAVNKMDRGPITTTAGLRIDPRGSQRHV
jgi:hypothetical protein